MPSRWLQARLARPTRPQHHSLLPAVVIRRRWLRSCLRMAIRCSAATAEERNCGPELRGRAVGSSWGFELWTRAVDTSCELVLWTRATGSSCGAELWIRSVGPNCGSELWTRAVSLCCGTRDAEPEPELRSRAAELRGVAECRAKLRNPSFEKPSCGVRAAEPELRNPSCRSELRSSRLQLRLPSAASQQGGQACTAQELPRHCTGRPRTAGREKMAGKPHCRSQGVGTVRCNIGIWIIGIDIDLHNATALEINPGRGSFGCLMRL